MTLGCAGAALSEKKRMMARSQAHSPAQGKPRMLGCEPRLTRRSWVSLPAQEYDVAAIMGGLYGDGIIGLKGAFAPELADTLHEDMMTLFEEAHQVPGGALP